MDLKDGTCFFVLGACSTKITGEIVLLTKETNMQII